MEPLNDDVKPPTNVPRDLLARLYREIGVAAVAAALSDMADDGEAPVEQAAPIRLRQAHAA